MESRPSKVENLELTVSGYMAIEFDLGKIIDLENKAEKCIELLKSANKPVIVFTTGSVAQNTYKVFSDNGVSVRCFVDNSPAKVGNTLFGLDIISFDRLISEYSDSFVVLASRIYRTEILSQLKVAKFNTDNVICTDFTFYDRDFKLTENIKNNIEIYKEAFLAFEDDYSREVFINILNFRNTLDEKFLEPIRSSKPMYFDDTVIKLNENEVILDGGGYTGDTYEVFSSLCKNYRKYYLCEPDKKNLNIAIKKLNGSPDVEFINKGLWSKSGVLTFTELGNGSSQIEATGNTSIEVITIDEIIPNTPVTFIKTDIEGAEEEALKGAVNTLKTHKPKLAVCVYHKPMDLVTLPLLIKKINPSYKLYLRHYGFGWTDTVCYGV